MKLKFLLLAAFAIFSMGANAQDINEAVELFNKGHEAYKADNFNEAITSMEAAFQAVEALGDEAGEEGNTIKANCKNLIPDSYSKLGATAAKEKRYEDAINLFTQAKAAAEKYGSIDTFGESLGKQIETAKAAKYMEEGDLENALLSAKASGNDAFADNITKRIAANHLKEAQTFLKSKNYSGAIESATKSLEYNAENASTYLILGNANLQAKKYKDAIDAFEKSAELKPSSQVYYYLAAAYQQSGNDAKACQNYKKVTEGKLKENAQAQMKVICK